MRTTELSVRKGKARNEHSRWYVNGHKGDRGLNELKGVENHGDERAGQSCERVAARNLGRWWTGLPLSAGLGGEAVLERGGNGHEKDCHDVR